MFFEIVPNEGILSLKIIIEVPGTEDFPEFFHIGGFEIELSVDNEKKYLPIDFESFKSGIYEEKIFIKLYNVDYNVFAEEFQEILGKDFFDGKSTKEKDRLLFDTIKSNGVKVTEVYLELSNENEYEADIKFNISDFVFVLSGEELEMEVLESQKTNTQFGKENLYTRIKASKK